MRKRNRLKHGGTEGTEKRGELLPQMGHGRTQILFMILETVAALSC